MTHDEATLPTAPGQKADPKDLQVVYRNWRGETSLRNIRPLRIEFRDTEWHPEPQWIMRAFDLDKGAWRDFALRDMAPVSAEDAGELAKRCEEAADRVAKRCMGHDAPALISIPRQPTDIDAVLIEAAAALRRMAGERDSWEAQFHSAATTASEYVEFYERHRDDFDAVGNYIPYSQMDGDIRAAEARATAAEAALTHFQDDVWGAFQTWSMALGWGITGMQPECYAMMDASIDRMLSAEAEAERLKARVAEVEKALRALLGRADTDETDLAVAVARAALAQEGTT